MDSRDPSRLPAGLSQVLRERSDGAALWQGFTNKAQTTVFPGRRDLMADFSDAAKHLAFLQGTLEFALFPQARWPQRATSLGILNHMLAWEWAASEIKTHVGDLNWLRANSLDSIADIFSDAFALVGTCRPPPYTSGEMGLECFDSWTLINEQRVARRGRPFRDSATESVPAPPSVTLFRALLQRNHSRSHRHYLRARPISSQTGPICGRANVIWWSPQMMERSRRRCLASTWTRRGASRFPLQAWILV